MATQNEIQSRLNKFLDLLDRNPDGINKKDICASLNIKIRTLEGMRTSLCQKGYSIKTSGKGVGVWWRDKCEEINIDISAPPATKLYVEAAIILYIIQTSSEFYTKEGLFQKVRGLNSSVNLEDRTKIYASQSDKFKKIIDILKNEGQICFVKDKDGKEYIKPGKEAFVCFPVLNSVYDEEFQDAAYELLEYLNNYSGKLDKNLMSVKSKLELLIAGELREQILGYEVRGRHSDTSLIAEQIKLYLGNVDFRQNVIHIHYRDRKNILYEYDFKVGFIYYSKSLNNIYCLGEELENGEIYNLRLNGIEKAVEESDSNDIYMSEKYINIFEKMFGASYERAEYEVEVIFNKFGTVPDKIEQLAYTRKYAFLKEENGKLVYTDIIIGISEFAAFLRQFGRSCKAVKPKILRDEMANSPQKVLIRYREEGLI